MWAKSSKLQPLGCSICLKLGTIKCSWLLYFFAITQTKAMPKEEVPQEQAQYVASLCSMLLQMHQRAPSYFSSSDRHWFLHTRPWFCCPQIARAQRGASLRSGFVQALSRHSPHPACRDSTILVCSDHNEKCTRMLATGDLVPVRQILPCKMPRVSCPWVKIPGKLKREHINHIPKRSPTDWPKSCGFLHALHHRLA